MLFRVNQNINELPKCSLAPTSTLKAHSKHSYKQVPKATGQKEASTPVLGRCKALWWKRAGVDSVHMPTHTNSHRPADKLKHSSQHAAHNQSASTPTRHSTDRVWAHALTRIAAMPFQSVSATPIPTAAIEGRSLPTQPRCAQGTQAANLHSCCRCSGGVQDDGHCCCSHRHLHTTQASHVAPSPTRTLLHQVNPI